MPYFRQIVPCIRIFYYKKGSSNRVYFLFHTAFFRKFSRMAGGFSFLRTSKAALSSCPGDFCPYSKGLSFLHYAGQVIPLIRIHSHVHCIQCHNDIDLIVLKVFCDSFHKVLPLFLQKLLPRNVYDDTMFSACREGDLLTTFKSILTLFALVFPRNSAYTVIRIRLMNAEKENAWTVHFF